MEKEYKEENKEEQVVDTAKMIKRVRKSRKVRSSRRKQTALRKAFRFFMTIFLLVILGYVSKLPQWCLPKNTFTTVNNNITIKNNKIVKSNRILAFLKLHKVPDKPIYMLRTDDIEKDIKKLRPIKEVYIRRYAFPARLQIIVKERNPILSIALDENSPIVGVFAEDGVLIGHEFMPLSPDIKTIKVITKYGGEDSYTKWTLAKVQEIQKIAEEIELYAEEPLEYIDIRNPNDIYAKVKTTKIRVGKPDGSVFERIKRIPSILPQIKLINTKVQYLDISWEKVNYLKLK
jgi:cell division septal protein FtsQ